jgi:hypothetical protein
LVTSRSSGAKRTLQVVASQNSAKQTRASGWTFGLRRPTFSEKVCTPVPTKGCAVGTLLFWLGVLVAVGLIFLAAKLYDRKYRNSTGEPGAGQSQGAVLDQETGRNLGGTGNW